MSHVYFILRGHENYNFFHTNYHVVLLLLIKNHRTDINGMKRFKDVRINIRAQARTHTHIHTHTHSHTHKHTRKRTHKHTYKHTLPFQFTQTMLQGSSVELLTLITYLPSFTLFTGFLLNKELNTNCFSLPFNL